MFELIVSLTIIGALLVFIEMFVPGMVAGVCGGLALFAALALTYAQYGIDRGNTMLAVVLGLAMVLFLWWMRAFPNTRWARRWMLDEEVPDAPEQFRHAGLEGSSGRALTTLRPAGTALIDNRRVDVIAESSIIEAGAAIRVVRVEGPKVVVRPVA
jgi:membrane-bound serine protease (ClpP class)